ncbi:MAG: hypothetical protein IKP97_00985 [Kiritimatiellae bacterium]|nr:hypothetical protein [Kiritimatiellia bacterium]
MKIDLTVLHRLGPIPFWRGEKKFLDQMELLYKKAIEKSTKALDEHD